jgi:hypothetical protein
MLTKHQRITVELAVRVLRNTLRIAGKERVDTVPVRLALRCLLPHCPERWPLTSFWEAAGQERELNRSQGVTAAFNGIVRQLRLSGAVADVSFLGEDP